MDFFSKVKRAFGFPDDDSEYDDEMRASMHGTPYVNPFRRDNDNIPAQTRQDESRPAATEADVAALKAQMQQLLSMMRSVQKLAQQRDTATLVDNVPEGEDNDIRQRLHISETQRRAALSRANSLSEKIEELQVKVNTLENDKKGLLNKIRVMQVKAGGDAGTDTTNAIEKMMEQQHAELAEKDRQIELVKQQLEQVQMQLEESTRQVEAADACQRQLAEAKENWAAATSEADEAKQRVQQLEERVKQLEDELNEANANLEIAAQLQQKLEEVDLFKQKKDAEIAQLRAEVDKLSHDQDYRPKFEQAEKENASLRKTIDQLNALAKDTAEKHKRRDIDVANHIDALKAQLASAATVVERHRADREQMLQQMAKLNAEATKSQDALRDKEAELDETRATLTVANAQIEQLRNELEQLSQQLAGSTLSEEKSTDHQPAGQEEPNNTPSAVNHFAAIEQDLDDIDWLLPAVPDQQVVVESEPEPEPESQLAADPRQLSLF